MKCQTQSILLQPIVRPLSFLFHKSTFAGIYIYIYHMCIYNIMCIYIYIYHMCIYLSICNCKYIYLFKYIHTSKSSKALASHNWHTFKTFPNKPPQV